MKTTQLKSRKKSLRRDFNAAFKKFATRKNMRMGLPNAWRSMRFVTTP